MKRMSGLDAMFLGLETPRCYQHTFKIAIIDPSTHSTAWCFERFKARLDRRLHRLPILRWRYMPAPLGLGHPLWVEDPDFRLDYHLRRVACPPPGDHRALCEFISSVYAYQLDRSRPLWICWVVEGLKEGKVALVILLHHAYVDGVGAAHGMQQFFDLEPVDDDGAEPPPWNPPPVPSWTRRLLAGMYDLPSQIAGAVPPVISGLYKKRQLERTYRKLGKPPHPSPDQMPATPLNRVLSHGRTFVCDSLPLEMLSQARIVDGATLNDVVLCCVAGALRRLLMDMDYALTHPLVAQIPVAAERPEGMESRGNFVATDFCWLHVEIGDAKARLIASHASAQEMKAHVEAARGSDITAQAELTPMALMRLKGRLIRRRGGTFGIGGNVAISNVRGPQSPFYFGPMEVSNWFSSGQIYDGTSLNVTLWSYCGKANLCILADSEALPNGWVLYDYFREELDKLNAAGDRREAAR